MLACLAAGVLVAAAPSARPPPDPALVVGPALTDGFAYARLTELTDTIGARLAGSPAAAAAVDWALRRFKDDGIDAHLEEVKVPRWERRAERAEVVAGAGWRAQALAVTALGSSPGTPRGGLTAEVVEARSLEEVEALGARAQGRIVLFQHDMAGPEEYEAQVALRSRGPAAAARAGAAGALVRSLATASLRTPHTGTTRFWPAERAIPAAALSVEDAALLHRLLARGPVRVRLDLDCGTATPPTADSANVVAEIKGRERPDEVVLVGAHLDSWDLGQGAVDDGAGVAMVMEVMHLLAHAREAPRRTVRAVLFMNEENGLSGGIAYAERHAGEAARHVAAIEADMGAARPLGLLVDAGEGGDALLRRLASPLAALGAAEVKRGEGGSDTEPLRRAGVPTLQLWLDGARYFDLHHSAADTLDKVAPRELAEAAAAYAYVARALADADETLPRPGPPDGPAWWAAPAPAQR
ncbi:MAG: M28 family peptidase [Anaeromyxobacteraceae bacterium]